jgi:hypothetical protein
MKSAAIGYGDFVWTKGRGFPLSRLETRLRCQMCDSRDVVLLITIGDAGAE